MDARRTRMSFYNRVSIEHTMPWQERHGLPMGERVGIIYLSVYPFWLSPPQLRSTHLHKFKRSCADQKTDMTCPLFAQWLRLEALITLLAVVMICRASTLFHDSYRDN